MLRRRPSPSRQHRSAPRLWACLVLLLTVAAARAEWPYDDDDPGRAGRGPRAVPGIAVGPRAGYDWDGETFTAGAQLLLPIPLGRARPATLAPSADVFNDGGGADWQANLDLLLSMGPGLYGGIGIAWVTHHARRTREINQLLGLRLPGGPGGRARPYIEARWTELNRDTVFRFVAGVDLQLWPSPRTTGRR